MFTHTSLKLPETHSEDYQDIQEDTVSVLMNFLNIKGKKSICQNSLYYLKRTSTDAKLELALSILG